MNFNPGDHVHGQIYGIVYYNVTKFDTKVYIDMPNNVAKSFFIKKLLKNLCFLKNTKILFCEASAKNMVQNETLMRQLSDKISDRRCQNVIPFA